MISNLMTMMLRVRFLLTIATTVLLQSHVGAFLTKHSIIGPQNGVRVVPTKATPRGQSSHRRLGMGGSDASSAWSIIEKQLGDSFRQPLPSSIDSVLDPSTPSFSSERPTLFRER
jgi:hypothetical protein